MMRILAVARITVLGLLRSRVVLTLAVAVSAVVVLLPLAIEDDGTVEGRIKVALQYTLRAVFYLLAATTVWMACGTAARDISGQQMHLVVTKPVGRGSVWLGKWLGVITVDAMLLLLAGAGVWLALSVLLPQDGDGQWNRLAARSAVLPSGAAKVDPIPAGGSRAWTFELPRSVKGETAVVYHFNSPRQLDLKPLAVVWLADGREVFRGRVFFGRPHAFTLKHGGGLLALEFHNEQTSPPAEVLLDQAQPVRVMVPAGSFAGNLARALLVLLFELAGIAALGIAAGCLLHTATANFAAYAALTVLLLGGFVSLAAEEADVTIYRPVETVAAFDDLIRTHFKLFNALLSPMRGFDPVPLLAAGEFIPWLHVLSSFAVLILCYSGAVAFVGIVLFKRRELGLPSE